jgi:hypothetical protein
MALYWSRKGRATTLLVSRAGYGLTLYLPVQPLYAPQMTQEREIDWLKSQAEAIKAELNRIEARIHDLETGE